jgi:hypothetical protein
MINTDNIQTETVKISTLSLHDLSLTTPSYTPERFTALKISIASGQTDAVLVYRNKIVDGRHRYKALLDIGSEDIIIKRLPHSSTVNELRLLVESKEMRRHETKAQQALYAVKQMNISNAAGEKMTQSDAATIYGVTVKEIGRAVRIQGSKKGQFNRPDITERLFSGEKINIGTSSIPFLTDSLQSIINWLGKEEAALVSDVTGIKSRDKLNHDEEILINQLINRIDNESSLLKSELANRLYSIVKESK